MTTNTQLFQDKISTLFLYNSIEFIMISIVIIFIFFITFKLSKKVNTTDLTNLKNNEIDKNDLDVNEVKSLMSFFDNLLKTKFNYYLINEILPIYSAGKTIDKVQFKELQKEFFLDISSLINKKFKKLFLKYFTAPGLELYINEQFIYFLNKFDSIQSSETDSLDNKSIHSIIK